MPKSEKNPPNNLLNTEIEYLDAILDKTTLPNSQSVKDLQIFNLTRTYSAQPWSTSGKEILSEYRVFMELYIEISGFVRATNVKHSLNMTEDAQNEAVQKIAEIFAFSSPSALASAGQEVTGRPAARPPLPEVAPYLYAERNSYPDRPDLAGLNIIDFLKAVYGPWLDGTLTRPDLKHLDQKAYMALANWLRAHDLPEGFHLPTKTEAIDADIGDSSRVKAARRLVRAHDRRKAVTL